MRPEAALMIARAHMLIGCARHKKTIVNCVEFLSTPAIMHPLCERARAHVTSPHKGVKMRPLQMCELQAKERGYTRTHAHTYTHTQAQSAIILRGVALKRQIRRSSRQGDACQSGSHTRSQDATGDDARVTTWLVVVIVIKASARRL